MLWNNAKFSDARIKQENIISHLILVFFDETQKRTRASDVTSLADVDEVRIGTNPQRFQP